MHAVVPPTVGPRRCLAYCARVKHLVLLLHAGDYLDADRRRAQGLPDRYRHHSYALESLEQLVSDGASVSVIQLHSSEEYDEQGASKIRFVGLGVGDAARAARLVGSYLSNEAATHVMLRTPSTELLQEVASAAVRASVALADSFPFAWRHHRRYRELGALLSGPRFDFVANHHLNSAQALVRTLNVPAAKVIAWDWPLDLLDSAASSSSSLPDDGVLRLCFVGSLTRSKGVWDAVEAVRLLRGHGTDARLEVAGGGQTEELRALVARHRLGDAVLYRGRIGGDDILDMMRRSTFVCVPSRHSYPEGLPLTLFEAMASGTPIVASDHPMFAGVVRDGETGFVFRAGPPGRARRLAAAVRRGWSDPATYEAVSVTSAAAYADLGLTTLWGDLLRRWVRDDESDRAWLREVSLASTQS